MHETNLIMVKLHTEQIAKLSKCKKKPSNHCVMKIVGFKDAIDSLTKLCDSILEITEKHNWIN